ncbi:MAG: MATE family efflux transporter [Rhodocyclaceae bacterium]|nr:MATE family efflux transporter [Rhodocyclaceae bacterium]MBX3669293.1 MATE family efflux transporter [Rhodocyclaceae bacterium]
MLIAQLASMAMNVADTVIVGRFGTTDLAAVAVGSGIYISVVISLAAVTQAVSPTVAHHFGAGRLDQVAPEFQHGACLALMLALPGVSLLLAPDPLLALTQLSPEVEMKARAYLRALACGLPAVLLYRAFHATNHGLGRPRPLMYISLGATAGHIPLAWSLVSGSLTGQPLGALGCGISTATLNWASLGAGALYATHSRFLSGLNLFRDWRRPQPQRLWQLVRLGLPMGFSSFVETTSFTFIALFVASLGAEVVAGHRIVANLYALCYMLPLALASGTLVLVGQACGAQDAGRARATAHAGVATAAVCGAALGTALWAWGDTLVAAYTADPDVRRVARTLLPYVMVFLAIDGTHTVASFSLRGYKVTAIPMLIHVVCFWVVALGGGWWLCFRTAAPMGAAGFWLMAVLGTLAAALLVLALLEFVARRAYAPMASADSAGVPGKSAPG